MKVAIVGASGLVGQKLAEILATSPLQPQITLYGNATAGQKTVLGGKTYVTRPVEQIVADKPQFATFMATEEVAKRFVPTLTQNGTTCIDNSAAFRLHKNVPLVVPQINGSEIGNAKLIANPNCTTIQVAIALHALLPLEPRKLTVATYQAISGAGKDGLEDFAEKRSYGRLKCFPHPVWDNILPLVGQTCADGFTTEEHKMRNECRKILGLKHLFVNCFCARVPVSVGHCAFVNAKFKRPVSAEVATDLLRTEKDVTVFSGDNLPMPQIFRNTHLVGVGRIHGDGCGGLNMFVVADNLLRGAAYNAYQILEICAHQLGAK